MEDGGGGFVGEGVDSRFRGNDGGEAGMTGGGGARPAEAVRLLAFQPSGGIAST